MRSYYLGKKFANIYFTQREADCMVQLLQGKKNAEIAGALNLSCRTVEFYLNNMRSKLHCKTRRDLVAQVLESDFQQNFRS